MPEPDHQVAFEEAKEATRRAVFLNTARHMTSDETYKQNLARLFQICRSKAISAGAAMGLSERQIDEAISALCDDDYARLKNASHKEFVEFAKDSHEIVQKFLAKLDRI